MKAKYGITLTTCLILLSLTCAIQNKPGMEQPEQITFIKYIGDTGINRGVTVEEINDGGYILTGYTTEGNYGAEDVFLIKTNAKGDTLWKKTYGGKGSDNGWAVRQTADKGFIVAGYTNSFGNGGMDIYLLKTDSKGKALWTKTFGGAEDEYGWDVRITKDNGFIIAAQTSSEGNGEIDAYLIKVDEKGNKEWSQTYGGDKVDRIFSVQQTPDGGYAAAGITYSYNSINPSDRDGYILKTNPTGQQEWYKTFGKDAYDVGHSIALTDDGGLFITGYGESFATAGHRDVYLIKTDTTGENQWMKVYGEIGEERGIKGHQTKDGGYIAIGFTSQNRDVYLIKTNNSGETLWTRTYGSPDKMDFGYTVKETKDGGFILTGHSEPFSREKSDILLIKTDSEGLVDEEN